MKNTLFNLTKKHISNIEHKIKRTNININIPEQIKQKRLKMIYKKLNYDHRYSSYTIRQSMQGLNKYIRENVHSAIDEEKKLQKQENLIRLSLGSKAISEDLIKKQNNYGAKEFHDLKRIITAKYPELEKLNREKKLNELKDLEAKVNLLNSNELDLIHLEDMSAYENEKNDTATFTKITDEISIKMEALLEAKHDAIAECFYFEEQKEQFIKENNNNNQKLNEKQEFELIEDTPIEILKDIMQLLPWELNFSEAYFNNKIPLQELRIANSRLEYSLVDKYKDYMFIPEKDNKDIHLIKRDKDYVTDMTDCIFSPTFNKEMVQYTKTVDNHRIDMSLILNRPPIFINMPKEEINHMKYRREVLKNYDFSIEKHFKDLEIHNDNKNEVFVKIESILKDNDDNLPNYRKVNTNDLEDGYDFYSSISKHYKSVDPNIYNDKSIQTESLWNVYFICKNKITKQWEFPTISLINGDSFGEAKEKLVLNLFRSKFEIYSPYNSPISQITREFYKQEENDVLNSELNGVRTYYFIGYHYRGAPCIDINDIHDYEDFAIVSKNLLNNYLNEDYYKSIIKCLKV